MRRAQNRDAVHREKFYFRKSCVPEDDPEEGAEPTSHDHTPKSHDHEYTEMSINTIVNGKVTGWPFCSVMDTVMIIIVDILAK